MKKILSLIAVVAMLSVCFGISAMAAEGHTVLVRNETGLQIALMGSDPILLDNDITVTQTLTINNAGTSINLGGKTITCAAAKVFEVKADATISNGTIINTAANGRCVDTRTNVNLTLDGVTLKATRGNSQPLTIGGADNGTSVTLKDSAIDAGESGYGVIAFVKNTLTVTNSDISGYAALYYKDGSDESTITVDADSSLNGTGHAGEAFGTIFTEVAIDATIDGDVTAENVADSELSAVNLQGTASKIALNGTVDADFALAGYTTAATVTAGSESAKDAFANSGCTVAADGKVTYYIADVDGVKYESLQEAVNAADGKTVTLINDAMLYEKIVVNGNVTLDLCGKDLGLADIPDNYAVVIKGALTINDTAETGYVYVPGLYGIGLSTSCTGGLTVNGGEFVQEDDGYYLIGAFGGDVVINGGSFSSPYCVVNSFDGYTASVEITDGEFEVTGADSEAAPLLGISFEVSGGTYSEEIPAEYCADGFSITTNSDGTFGVQESAISWTTAQQGAAYEKDEVSYGVIRFLFHADTADSITAYGIKFASAADISKVVTADKALSKTGAPTDNAFYADVIEIGETDGTIYAMAYVTINGKTYWSPIVNGTANFENVVNYGVTE